MTWLRTGWDWLRTQKTIEAQEVMLGVGIVLVAYGVAQWSIGAACIAAGVIVLALAWPPDEAHHTDRKAG